MFDRLGRFVVRRRWFVLGAVVLLLGAAGAIGGGVAERLTSAGFENKDSESFRGAEMLEDTFGIRDPNLILLAEAQSGSVDDAAAARAGAALTEDLAAEMGVADVVSYWTTGSQGLRSDDGSEALIVGTITGSEDVADERAGELTEDYTRTEGPLSISVGGQGPVFHEVSTQVEEDLVRAESIAIPITLVLLVFVFGSVVAAMLPLAIGVFAIIGSFFALFVITEFADVSIFSLNLITMLGLGLGIDYSLFIVSRYREELGRGLDPRDAVVATVTTAGRTIAFSGITVALSLAALMLFPLDFLRSFAYAGIAVVLLAAVAATVFLPAVLAVLGHRVERLSIRRRREARSEDDGFWHRMATVVMRRPIPIATTVVVVLLLLGAPFLGVEWGQTDHRVLPEESDVRQVSERIAEDFSVNNAEMMSITVPEDAGAAELSAYAAEVSSVTGVANVQSEAGTFAEGRRVAPPGPDARRFAGDGGTWLSVSLDGGNEGLDGREVVRDVRALGAPFERLVSGGSASQVDAQDSLFSRVPWAALWIAGATFVLLFLMFGSVLVPAKAVVLNLLSLTATFGAVVWIFQEGNLSGPLDFTSIGAIDVTTPILMFCIAFGLSMDYEVFLLSRIKEEHDRTGDNQSSVALGLERTGRIVTAAALLLSVVFVAFATSSVTFIKMFGVGLTIAVLVDASLVRATLVPAFMRLAGEANWWAPRWMRRVYDRFGISEIPEPALLQPAAETGDAA